MHYLWQRQDLSPSTSRKSKNRSCCALAEAGLQSASARPLQPASTTRSRLSCSCCLATSLGGSTTKELPLKGRCCSVLPAALHEQESVSLHSVPALTAGQRPSATPSHPQKTNPSVHRWAIMAGRSWVGSLPPRNVQHADRTQFEHKRWTCYTICICISQWHHVFA